MEETKTVEIMSNLLLRCSSLGKLMTQPKTKADRENGILSETTKGYLDELIFSVKYGREKEFSNKYTEKGLEVEQDGIHLLNTVKTKLYRKNQTRFENGLITGMPDIVTSDSIIDIKSCFDFSTFLKKKEIEKDYFWQLCGYCALTGKKKGAIAYTLNNTPFHLILNEFTSRYYKNGLVDLSDDDKARITHNHIYSDKYVYDGEVRTGYWEECRFLHFPTSNLEFIPIDDSKRLRFFEVEFTDEDFEALDLAIERAINYITENIDLL